MSGSRQRDIFQPGDLLNNTYRIDSILGRGGTSEVYLARSEISGRLVALKALKSEFSTNEDFLILMTREEEIRDVRHDAVVRYYDNQRMPDGLVYLVMDYVEGPGLDVVLSRGVSTAEDLMTIGARVSDGLIAAHAHGVVHRDLSPDNIILRNGKPEEAVIIDFGIAKDTNPGAETIVGNEFAGKYSYAAPEQLSGNTDARSDIYALGALLLAAFRGKKPDVGANPMEVVQKKAQPLDLEGVPEPLRGLIAKMTDPVPDKRFQTAEETFAAFQAARGLPAPQQSEATVPPPVLEDATVIAPRPKAQAKVSDGKKSSSGVFALLAVVLLAVGAAAAFFAGAFDRFLGPSYPVANPYTLIVERTANTAPRAEGNVPSPEIAAALSSIMDTSGGTANLELASGEIPEAWGEDMLSIVDTVSILPEYKVAIIGDMVRIAGLADDPGTRAEVLAALNDNMPASFNGSAVIEQGPLFLQASAVEPVVEAAEDCGALMLETPSAVGFGMDTPVVVSGKLASAASEQALRTALQAVVGDRPLNLRTEILSPQLCMIENVLPDVPSGGFRLDFGFGGREDLNTTGVYLVGDNPVIDVVVPATVDDGFIYVAIIDVSDNVFHLMPNLNRTENAISVLRAGATSDFKIRVAFSVEDAGDGDTGRLAFLVDDSTQGKSKVLVLHANRPLFDGLRPTTESVASFAQALREAHVTGDLSIKSLDSRILTTATR